MLLYDRKVEEKKSAKFIYEIILAIYQYGPERQHEQASYDFYLDYSLIQAEVFLIRLEMK